MLLGGCGCEDLFLLLRCDGNSEGTVKVDTRFVRLFLGFYQQEDFQNQDNNISEPAKDCLQMAWHMGRAPNLNNAHLALRPPKLTPCRAQIQWYKVHCDESGDQLGYYDTLKKFAASRRESLMDMNLFRLGAFWDEVICMAAWNELLHDFHRRSKWINVSHFYMLLAKPLEIARYYHRDMHKEKGHYIKHGRNRRFQILERWWNQKVAVAAQENNNRRSRSRYASCTQDSWFWARVEEAEGWLKNAKEEKDQSKLELLLANINGFEEYAGELIKWKEVSIDVLAEYQVTDHVNKDSKAFKLKLSQPPSALLVSDMLSHTSPKF